jgi:hypothetical protein
LNLFAAKIQVRPLGLNLAIAVADRPDDFFFRSDLPVLVRWTVTLIIPVMLVKAGLCGEPIVRRRSWVGVRLRGVWRVVRNG